MAYTAYTSITPVAAGSVSVKGAYTQIVAATPYDSSRLYVIAEFSSASLRPFLLDIATGAASSEVIVVSNVALDTNTDQIAGVFLALNVDIPAGTRLSARVASGVASSSITLHFYLENQALTGVANPVTYGAASGSQGTIVDPGTTINTKGSYVQLSASTTSRIDTLIITLTTSLEIAITAGTRWAVDVATGAGGAETIILPDLTVTASVSADAVRPAVLRFPVSIPASTRLAVRCNCNVNTATQRLLCVTLIGMQEPASTGGGLTSVAFVG